MASEALQLARSIVIERARKWAKADVETHDVDLKADALRDALLTLERVEKENK